MIDWTLPLETDEPAPRRAIFIGVDEGQFLAYFGTMLFRFERDGKSSGSGPSLRNVRTLRTSDECLQRMEALVRKLAGYTAASSSADEDLGIFTTVGTVREAREIVKLLPEQVNPWAIEASEICNSLCEGSIIGMQVAVAALKRGAELAHAEYERWGDARSSDGTYGIYQRKSEALAVEPIA